MCGGEAFRRESLQCPITVLHHVVQERHDPLVLSLGAGHQAEWMKNVCVACLVNLMFVGDGGDAGGATEKIGIDLYVGRSLRYP